MSTVFCAEVRKLVVLKLLPLLGMIVSGMIAILFLADLAAGFPFGRTSVVANVGFVLFSAIVCYLSWSLIERNAK